MDILSNVIKLFFGSKTDKDRKQIEPYVRKIKEIYPSIERLSNDELREHSAALMKRIADFIAADEAHIVEQKDKLEHADISLSEKEKISKDIAVTTTVSFCVKRRAVSFIIAKASGKISSRIFSIFSSMRFTV